MAVSLSSNLSNLRPISTRKRRHEDSAPNFSTQACSHLNLTKSHTRPSTPPSFQSHSNSVNWFSETHLASPSNLNLLGRPNSSKLLLLYRQVKLWNIVRRHHGIMVLLYHLEIKNPISDADSIRTLACRGLVGLARSEEVRSMLAKLPLFTKALLQCEHFLWSYLWCCLHGNLTL